MYTESISSVADKQKGEKALPHSIMIEVDLSGDKHKKESDVLFYVFCVLLKAMGYRQDTVYTDAKKLQLKATLSESWETREEALQYRKIDSKEVSKMSPAQLQIYLNQLMLDTNNVQDQKNYCQNVVLTLRQSTQVITTQSNADISALTTMTSMNSALVQMLVTIANYINQKAR